MALQFDWNTNIITVPKDYTFLLQTVPSEIRQLDLQVMKDDIKAKEGSEEGMSYKDIHTWSAGVSVSGAILAPVLQFINGWTVTFEDGQYRVNVVGANTNIGEITNVNQVSVSTSNSAGLQDLNSLQAASYGGSVAIDINATYGGTVFPTGTRAYPVNNLADCLSIAQERGLHIIEVLSSMTLSSSDFSVGYQFKADSAVTVTLTLNPATNVQNCEFVNATITGTLDGYNTFRGCTVVDVNFFNGSIVNSALEGTVTLGGGLEASIIDSYSGIAGGGTGATPIIDMGGSGQSLVMRNYSGGIDIRNAGVGTNDSSIDMNSGRVVFDADCVGGTFWVRGIAQVTDNSVGSIVLDYTETLKTERIDKRTGNTQEVINDAGTVKMRTYDNDGVTVYEEHTLKNPSGGVPTLPPDSITRREV